MNAFRKIVDNFPEYVEELEERAAIMEYHGGYSHDKAEAMAAARIMDKYELWEKVWQLK
jgi:hypothetical protein